MKDKKLKNFIIKLILITFAVIIVLNVTYNLFLAERFEKIDKILSIVDIENKSQFKDKIYKELNKGLEKKDFIDKEDKILIYKIYKKIKKEFQSLELNSE